MKIILYLIIILILINARVNICQFSDSVTNRTLHPSLSVSGGFGILTGYYRNNMNSFVFDIEGTTFLSQSNGLRGKVNLNYFLHSNNSYPGYWTEGGNLFMNLFSADLLVGNFIPESRVNYYFEAGLGLVLSGQTKETQHTPNGVYTYDGNTSVTVGASLGPGINAKLSKMILNGELNYSFMPKYIQVGILNLDTKVSYIVSKSFAVFLEPEYLFPVSFAGEGYFGITQGYFTLKAGLTLSKF